MPPAENLASSYTQPYLWGGSTSCGSAGFCAEVGGYSTESELGSGTIVVPINDGVAAPAVQVALPANAYYYNDGGLNSVSCWGASSCIAVGSYGAQVPDSDSSESEALAVPITNGQVGQAVEVALPSNAADDASGNQDAQLNSVSCDPSGACVAVGSYVDGNGNTEAMVVPITGGSAGSAVEVTLPQNSLPDFNGSNPEAEYQSAELNSVSCDATGACVAVGDYVDNAGTDGNSGNQEAMVVPVSSAGVLGTSTMLTLPSEANASSPSSSPEASLDQVSCSASGSCAAIGGYAGNGSGEMVASISAAGAASPATEVLATVSDADSSTDVWSSDVGCGSAGCDVVGSYGDNNGSTQALVIPVSGGAGGTVLGNEVTVALPGDAVQDGTGDQWATLYSISCPATGACLASGGYTGDYAGANIPGYDGLIPENVNALLVGISGTSVDTGTSAPLPQDAAADGRLSFGAGVGCGATGSCAVTSVYLKGFTSTTDLINALECLAYSEGENRCNYSGTVQPYIISAQAPLTITPGNVSTTVTAGATSVSLASAASGGWGPYQWSVANGNTLPAGLSLNPFTGEISGTPQAAGTYNLWVRADSPGTPGQNAEALLTLKVGAGATTATTTSTTNTITTATVSAPSSGITPAVVGNHKHHKPSIIVVRGNLRDHGGAVNVHLRCHSWGRCTGTVTLTWHGQAISNASHLSIAAGRTAWVTVHLNAKGMKEAASLSKPHHGYPTMNVTVVPKLKVGQGIPHSRPMWVIS